jgi:hypothetical protein
MNCAFRNGSKKEFSQVTEGSDIIISGAGITGIAAAFHCHRRGIKSEIHEARPVIGGILRDWNVGDDWFFRNCQYITPHAEWFKMFSSRCMHTFENRYGSFTDLWGEPCVFKGFAGPVYSERTTFPLLNRVEGQSLGDRIRAYPEPISEALFTWVRRFGVDPENIHSSGARGLQILRVFPLHFSSELCAYKERDQVADDLYGLPRDALGQHVTLAVIPKDGFTVFFDQIQRDLVSKNIPLKLKSTVRLDEPLPAKHAKNIETPQTFIVWTGNPIPLLKTAFKYKLDAPHFAMRNIVMKWDRECFKQPFYIHVFSRKCPITRIFVYFNKATIECLDDGTNVEEIEQQVLAILQAFGYKNISEPNFIHAFREMRHFLCSTRDYFYLSQFKDKNIYPRLIPSPWHMYGRDTKIESLMNALDNRCF